MLLLLATATLLLNKLDPMIIPEQLKCTKSQR